MLIDPVETVGKVTAFPPTALETAVGRVVDFKAVRAVVDLTLAPLDDIDNVLFNPLVESEMTQLNCAPVDA